VILSKTQNEAKILTNSPFGHSGTKITWPEKAIALKTSKASKKKFLVSFDEDSDVDEDAVAMLAKNFERFMMNNKFKKKFSDRLRKAPHTSDT
jgi:hypothetical protein